MDGGKRSANSSGCKSVTKYTDAYIEAVEQRYRPLINDMRMIDPAQPSSLYKPADTLVKLLQESGVSVTSSEAVKMLQELTGNKDKAYKNFSNILIAVNTFRAVVNK